MLLESPTRPALSPLSVNISGTSSTRHVPTKPVTGVKRSIEQIDAPEYPSPAPKSRLAPFQQHEASERKTRDADVQDRVDVAATALSSPMEKDSTSAYPTTMEIDAGQPSNQASTASSVLDYDPDDTMETQQTTATEVTDSVQSRVSQHLETLRLRLRLARFKVQTNQTSIPFAQLRVSTGSISPKTSSADLVDGQRPQAHRPAVSHSHRVPVGQGQRMADHVHSEKGGRLSVEPLSPAPPNASQGCIAPVSEHSHASSSDGDEEEQFQTPALPRNRMNLPGYGDASCKSQKPHEWKYERHQDAHEDNKLTSSALRGKAAIGLLGLKGVGQY